MASTGLPLKFLQVYLISDHQEETQHYWHVIARTKEDMKSLQDLLNWINNLVYRFWYAYKISSAWFSAVYYILSETHSWWEHLFTLEPFPGTNKYVFHICLLYIGWGSVLRRTVVSIENRIGNLNSNPEQYFTWL